MKTRVRVVDAIRGFSLLGILLANMLIFQFGIFGKEERVYVGADRFFHDVLKVFVETSFMPIFAFLFGYGMIWMYSSLKEKGLGRKRHFVRRYIGLLVLGLLHGTLIWEGDILFSYAMVGFLLMFFVKRKAKTVLIWGIALLSIFSLLSLGGEVELTPAEQATMNEYLERTDQVYGSGTFGEIMAHREDDSVMMLGMGDAGEAAFLFLFILAPFAILPMFLFGMYAAKREWFSSIVPLSLRWKKGAAIGITAGVLFKAVGVLLPDVFGAAALYSLGGPVLALGYIALLGLVFERSRSVVVRSFEAVGRLSLTNYLMQSIIAVSIFYGYGLGLFNELSVLTGMFLAVAIFSVQCLLSVWYLKYFRQGPFEWLLRGFTYFWSQSRKREIIERKAS